MAMPTTVWVRRARLVRLIDGDTLTLVVDLGFGIQIGHDPRQEIRVRLLGLDCPEVHGPTKAAGLAAAAYTRAWLAEAGATDWPLIVQTEKPDSFGRYLATVFRSSDKACLNADLIANKFAIPFMVEAG